MRLPDGGTGNTCAGRPILCLLLLVLPGALATPHDGLGLRDEVTAQPRTAVENDKEKAPQHTSGHPSEDREERGMEHAHNNNSFDDSTLQQVRTTPPRLPLQWPYVRWVVLRGSRP
eukprot:scaffold795_cov375-Prasinococcus_capsulatus_cf.AAC.8